MITRQVRYFHRGITDGEMIAVPGEKKPR